MKRAIVTPIPRHDAWLSPLPVSKATKWWMVWRWW